MQTNLREAFPHTWTQSTIRRMGYRIRIGRAVRIPYAFRLPVGLRATHRRVHPYEGLLPSLLHRSRIPTRAASLDIEVQRASMTQVYLRLD